MALEVVGGAFLSAFFEAVFDKMSSLEVWDFIRGKNLEGGLRKLRTALLSANALVDDAEEKQLSNDFVKQWLFHLKEAVYDAEDLVADIKAEALRRKLQKADHHDLPGCADTITSKAQQLISACFHPFDRSVDPKLNEIIGRLDSLANQKGHLNLKEGAKHARLSTTSLVDDSGVYGRDEDTKTLIELLCTDDATPDKIGVISIVGMGGLGKTTLAKLLSNNDKVKRHFNFLAWVCVSEEFDVFGITQTIYKSVSSQSSKDKNLNELQVSLKEALTGKKFFFVLDDVWDEKCDLFSCWEDLRLPFASAANGSKIIITTRDKNVASKMGTFSTHYLEKISEEHSWRLFAKHALNKTSGSAHPKLVEIGRQIVIKCDGLPLAAKSLGGLLHSKLDVKEWEEVLKSEIWGLPDKKNEILPALLLSYHYLPLHLKRCFAYCSIFPKDFEFKKSKLILLWMAEDLLQPTNEKMIEEVGEYYFNELTSRSFFQHSSRDDNHFTMHDLINDVATFVSGKFCVRLENKDSINIGSKTRHVSYVKTHLHSIEKFEALYEAKHLRTFLPLSLPRSLSYYINGIVDLLLKLQCLRVLNLSDYAIRKLPNSISKLKLLRYLDLSRSPIKMLPDTLCSLYNLQVLLLKRCEELTRLPSDLGRLINLRHLDIRETRIEKMPPHMGKLKDLQTLRGKFVLDNHSGGNIVELKEVQYLRGKFCISGLDNVVRVEDALEANLREKKYLKELVLEWGDLSDDAQRDREREVQVLDNLQPHRNLKALEILSYGGTRFPSWVGDESFSNLVSLRLEKCGYCLSLPSLGQLPSLEKLEIDGLKEVVSIGPEFYSGGFPNLCELSLEDCPKLSGRFPLDYFPKLEKLRIWNANVESLATSQCPKLLPSLTELDIRGCPNLVCFPDGGLQAPNLTSIDIWRCKKLRSLPEEMHTLLPSLESIYIKDCPELESFPEGGLPSKLRSLYIFDCKKVIAKRMQWGLQRLTSLKYFNFGFEGCEEVDSFPEEGLLPTTLTSLSIYRCLNLKTVNGKELRHLTSLQSLMFWNCPELQCLPDEGLPTSLSQLQILVCPKLQCLPDAGLPTSLSHLQIIGCPELQCLPDAGLPTSLSQLHIQRCPLLKQRCQRETGEDWPKIAHIPDIRID